MEIENFACAILQLTLCDLFQVAGTNNPAEEITQHQLHFTGSALFSPSLSLSLSVFFFTIVKKFL